MKFLMLSILIVLCQNQEVKCTFLNFLTDKILDIADVFLSTIGNLKEHVRSMFHPHIITNKNPPRFLVPPVKKTLQKSFTQILEEQVQQNESQFLEYLKLKSEPALLMPTPQLALFHGRRMESHVIHTQDGYILTIHRIPQPSQNVTNKTVILHHGLLGSSADWILLGANDSLPYLLSDVGYDVWLANARGNNYSRGHMKRGIDSADYWNFSWQEIGLYDLPAIIDYIRQKKNFTENAFEKIDYIGHSMGTTVLLVLLSSVPRYNRYLRIAILMAPLIYMKNVEGPLKKLSTSLSPSEELLNLIGDKEFFPSRVIPKQLALRHCQGSMLFCSNPLYFFCGGQPDLRSLNYTFVANLLYHVPAGGSTNTILHYTHLIRSGEFHKYNHENDEFPLREVTLPIVLMSSDDDWLSSIPDALKLYFSIASPVDHYIIRNKNFSHTDFVWGSNAKDMVFNKVLEFLENGLRWFEVNSNELQNTIL